ncbi:hypothetical protein RND71_009787 [Anisodus tanguticus]|uniref:Uncharacterized protein n=1 Tax=Anisodus tanguticus TaxID=243964 RepID=A0AAE1VIH9_9SOLA|nr:hypothetical protein RND71_009787 [Anisodus tanguticus]
MHLCDLADENCSSLRLQVASYAPLEIRVLSRTCKEELLVHQVLPLFQIIGRGGASHSMGTDRIPPGTENNMSEVLENSSNISALHGTPEVQQLATLLSSTRDTLVNQTSRQFLELKGDLRQNLNVGDPRMHHKTQSKARRIKTLINYLGTYFLQPGHVVMQVQMRENRL